MYDGNSFRAIRLTVAPWIVCLVEPKVPRTVLNFGANECQPSAKTTTQVWRDQREEAERGFIAEDNVSTAGFHTLDPLGPIGIVNKPNL